MKIKLFLAVLLTAGFVSSYSMFKQSSEQLTRQLSDDNRDTFVHATYIRGNWLKSRAQLKQTRFEQFNFMYVMAAPSWQAKDFELTEEQIHNKLVRDYAYPTGDSGLSLVPELIARAQQKNVKVLLSIPGKDEFNPVAADSTKRALFAKVMAAFVKKYNYDGIEIDWEHTYNRDQHTALMAELRKALDALEKSSAEPKREYYLTTALHSFRTFSPAQAQQLSASVDWLNIMTYDMGGGIWDNVASHNTPLDEMKKRLHNNWSVFSPDKLSIGLANYGFYYQGIAPGENSEVSLKEKGRYFSYTELPALLNQGWQESYDHSAQAPYYFSPDKAEFVTMDNKQSLSHKMAWAFEQQFRGVFWWEFSLDYFPAVAGKKYASHPLIDHVSQTILEKNK
ncbi:glycoside hydrolase family 18 protein [Thalassotalea sp. ND16A]|uniref:glycoside hydrolase family 18 protein n=1 Tax=Thalassotalea sp. ND16A TaxID=1535422 RepID=UPI00051A0E13|nr:glycoside hydrolase family 18 protein [Thalassotalea sp. ND16A]KGK00119.1 Chitinase [Thalassotalea sp. ND16A]